MWLLYVCRPGGQLYEELPLQGLTDTEERSGQAQTQGYLCGMTPLCDAGWSEEFTSEITKERKSDHFSDSYGGEMFIFLNITFDLVFLKLKKLSVQIWR